MATTTPTHPAHKYVLAGDEQDQAVAALAWRLANAPDPVAHVAYAPSQIDMVVMIGEALDQVRKGVLDRRGNVVVTRSLYLWGDHAGLPQPRANDAICLADHLFTARRHMDDALNVIAEEVGR